MGFPNGSVVKNPSVNAGDAGDASSIPGSGRSPGERNDIPLQNSCLENSIGRGAWRATVHRDLTESDTTELQHTPTTPSVMVFGDGSFGK